MNKARRRIVARGLSGWLLVVAALVCGVAQAVAQPVAQPGEKRVALVVGVGKYVNAPALANPPNDARAMGLALQKLGFQTETIIDPDYATMQRAILAFGRRLEGAKAALFYYAGHGMDVLSRNYLLPADFELTNISDLPFTAFDVQDVLGKLEGPGRASLVFLDACRDNPFAAALAARLGSRSTGVERGLGRMDRSVSGMLIAYATDPGRVAADGDGQDSPFTSALLKYIATPGLDVRQMLTRVRYDVLLATNQQQRPWTTESLDSDFYFVPAAAVATAPAPPAPTPTPTPVPPVPALEALFWQTISGSTNRADYEAYLQQFPQGVFAPLARNRLASLTPATAPAPVVQPAAPVPTAQTAAPMEDSAWPLADRRAVQAALVALGHLRGGADGEFGAGTRTAIQHWQAFEGLEETGRLTMAQRDRLLDDAAKLADLLRTGAKSPRGTPADAIRGGEARFDLAGAFERGDGKPKDAAEAAYWYALAAGDGWAAAYTNLGTLHVRGLLGRADGAAAERLWKVAAARDETTAMYDLGVLRERGIGVPVDLAMAKRWYARGAERRHTASAEALRRLGG